MFDSLKILQTNALKECKLESLGKINVVCGKNNSGKTTLLEGINSPDFRIIGSSNLPKLIEIIFSSSINFQRWEKNNTVIDKEFKKTIQNALSTQKTWYSDDLPIFMDNISTQNHKRLPVYNYDLNFPTIGNGFNNAFDKNPKIVFLPPKRNLDLMVNIETDQNPGPSGSGILNYLFTAKNNEYTSTLNSLFREISYEFEQITSGFKFDIFISETNTLTLKFSDRNNNWIEAKDCGLGLQEVLIILLFSLNSNSDYILLEEPESHIHPEMQKKLLLFFKNRTEKQFFISTHSNIFLDNKYIDKVFFTKYTDKINVMDATSRAFVLDDLGYSVADNLISDTVILTEGPTDIPIIEEFLIKMGLDEKYTIKIWPLGGDIMDQLDLSTFSDHYNILAIVDNDPGSSKVRNRFVKKCRNLKIPVTHLSSYSIENYFSLKALREVFNSQIPEDIDEIKQNEKLEKQIGLNVKKSNRKIAKLMTLDDIKGTDLMRFLTQVEKRCVNL